MSFSEVEVDEQLMDSDSQRSFREQSNALRRGIKIKAATSSGSGSSTKSRSSYSRGKEASD